MTSTWQELGAVAPTDLIDARLAAHWAAQIVGAVGSSRITPVADFSHTSFGWNAGLAALVTKPVDGAGHTAGLRVATLELVVASGTNVLASHALAGSTLIQGLAWMETTLDARTGTPVKLALPEHDMPAHAVSNGATFEAPDAAAAEVARWFANAHSVTTKVARAHGKAASPARCWPHHFDLATLITIAAHVDPEEAKTVGVGVSPGDAGYPQPYWYVTPWPRPDASTALGELPVGQWHTEGWTGAVLTGADLVDHDDQRASVDNFLAAALAAAKPLVG